VFGKKKGYPALTSPQIVGLLRTATADLNYGAVTDLYAIYGSAAPAGPALWNWWLDQVESTVLPMSPSVAATAIDFARKANIEPWGSLDSALYERMRRIESGM
jgi:hypothetical protein